METEQLGRYALLARIASGGMGDVFLAAKPGPVGFGPLVALKVLKPDLAQDAQFVEMLVDEANISMFLNHQNVVSVLDLGEENGRYFIAMEYVHGTTVQHLVDRLVEGGRTLEPPLALFVAGELCRALRYAHTRVDHSGQPLQIIHRDVTPGNVLLSTEGEVKLTDFGIARAKVRVHETQAGVVKGKFGYMAPELVRGDVVDQRADLFCVGVTLYLMLTGRHPCADCSVLEAVQRFESGAVEPPSRLAMVSDALDGIVMKALEPDPARRWSSAAELGAALQECLLASPTWRSRASAFELARTMRAHVPEAFDDLVDPEALRELWADLRDAASGPLTDPRVGTRPGFRTAEVVAEDPRAFAPEDTTPRPDGIEPAPPGGILEEPPLPGAASPAPSGTEHERTDAADDRTRAEPGPWARPEPTPVEDPGAWDDVSVAPQLGFDEPPLPATDDEGAHDEPDDRTRLDPAPRFDDVTPLGGIEDEATRVGIYDPEQLEALERTVAVSVPRGSADPEAHSPVPSVSEPTVAMASVDIEARDDADPDGPIELRFEDDAAPSAAPPPRPHPSDAPTPPPEVRPDYEELLRPRLPDLVDADDPTLFGDLDSGPRPRIEPERAPVRSAPIARPVVEVQRGGWSDDDDARRLLAERDAAPPAPRPTPSSRPTARSSVPSPRPTVPMTEPASPPGEVEGPTSRAPTAPRRNLPVLFGVVAGIAALVAVGGYVVLFTSLLWPRLDIETTPPGALVEVDGVVRGRTPLELRVAPRQPHRIELRKEGYAPAAREITGSTREGRTYRVSVPLRSVPTIYLSPPDAEVWVNGRNVGRGAEVRLDRLPEAGPIELTVRAPGHREWRRQYPSAGEVPDRFDVTLAPSE